MALADYRDELTNLLERRRETYEALRAHVEDNEDLDPVDRVTLEEFGLCGSNGELLPGVAQALQEMETEMQSQP